MKVDRTDSTVNSYTSKPSEQNTKTETDSTVATGTDTYKGRNYSQMVEQDNNEYQASEKMAISAIEKANKAISVQGRRFEYSIHEVTKQIVVKVVDSKTGELVREIPPEKILDMVAKMWEINGIIVDERI